MHQFQPDLSILPEPQLALWGLLRCIPKHFVLYGGTALALRLGHRASIDYDFFSASSFEPLKLFRSLASLENKKAVQVEEDTLTCIVETGTGPCQVSFFGGLTLRQVNIPDVSNDNNIAVASLQDVFGMKCATVPTRSESKDYLDIHALLTMSGLELAEGIAAAKAIYGNQYNPLQTLQALCYFDDLPEPLPEAERADLSAAVNEVNLDRLPEVAAHYQIAEGV
ncbi:MAG: nucleotidyl transferase AbiEii/AbiGii toxin family protein [Gammaproteobacteria bacterium]|nr:nucleotidyl transferase AbiEii/AbiGii toxin family protein [Gammaproteobacteria bacterium]MDE0284059.1 nucleotidyl transferase AbiEii/AbiGii toxin family protein [Gammaproteobacteria bacterium]MDE0511382.1 nucleotidyl transferase AbiEii/AbiGii toxin family protein [Gammaproteobacteria bacterium]